MKITVISDTHMPRKAKIIPTKVLNSIKHSQVLIHAGDFTSPDLLNFFESMTSVIAVAGNNDGLDIISRLGKKKIVELKGYRIGLIHGEGIHSTTINRVKKEFANEKVDIVIFGHSHQTYKAWENGILYFNPGSPTDKRRSPYYSYGEIVLGREIKSKLFYF